MATTASDLAAGAKAMVANARYTYEHRTLMTQLATTMKLGQGNKSQYIPKFGTVTANDLTDGVDMTEDQALTVTGTTHTTDEAGCKVIITKKLRNQLTEDAYKASGKVIGNAMAKKIDQDGLALFSGLDTTLGAAGSTFAVARLQAAVTQCFGQGEPVPEPLYCVLHPYTYHDIVTDLSVPGSSNIPPNVQEEVLRSYWRGSDKLYNVPVFACGNITIDTADDAYGAVFSKLAFIYLVGHEPENWVEEDGSLRGWELGIVADYAFVEEDGTYGRALLYDASAPTS